METRPALPGILAEGLRLLENWPLTDSPGKLLPAAAFASRTSPGLREEWAVRTGS
jgi:hypothetical protein